MLFRSAAFSHSATSPLVRTTYSSGDFPSIRARAGQIGYFTAASDTYILLNTVVNPGADGIDYEESHDPPHRRA